MTLLGPCLSMPERDERGQRGSVFTKCIKPNAACIFCHPMMAAEGGVSQQV